MSTSITPLSLSLLTHLRFAMQAEMIEREVDSEAGYAPRPYPGVVAEGTGKQPLDLAFILTHHGALVRAAIFADPRVKVVERGVHAYELMTGLKLITFTPDPHKPTVIEFPVHLLAPLSGAVPNFYQNAAVNKIVRLAAEFMETATTPDEAFLQTVRDTAWGLHLSE